MSLSIHNFQFYKYQMPASADSFCDGLEMDIDEESLAITSTPVQPANNTNSAAFQLTQLLNKAETPKGILPAYRAHASPVSTPLPALRPKLHTGQKRLSVELREKVLQMSRRNNGSDEEPPPLPPRTDAAAQDMQNRFMQKLCQTPNSQSAVLHATFTTDTDDDGSSSSSSCNVSDKINFFNKLTTTFESKQSQHKGNKFISLLRSAQRLSNATAGQMPPPKPKRLSATLPATASAVASPQPYNFAIPGARSTPPPSSSSSAASSLQRKSNANAMGLLRRKPSMEKSRATIGRQNSNATMRPQRHNMMEDLSLVVPVRLRIAEYEQRIAMCG